MGEKRFWKAEFALILLIVFLQFISSVDTEIEVIASPPYLIEPIPNQTWTSGNLTNAFDLNEYFGSAVTDSLIYSASAVENITVIINNTGNYSYVSFYPDEGFVGVRQIFFNASDGNATTTSNEVYLSIGQDTEPPQWFYVEKDKSIIYQNDNVVFSADWTDNFGLQNYTFSINQGSGYGQYNGDFSGTSNSSIQSVQISASSGQTIFWFFCARDTSNNVNCTTARQFLVSTRVLPPGTGGGDSDSDQDQSRSRTYIDRVVESIKREIKDFSVSVSSILVSIKQGSIQTRIFEVNNIGNVDLDFDLELIGLDGLAELGINNFFLASGESKKVSVDFYSKNDTLPGNYYGEITVSSVFDISIPIILEINPLESDVGATVKIPEEYKFVKPGEAVLADIILTNLKDPLEENITLYYSVTDFYGTIYASATEELFLNSKLNLIRNLTISEDTSLGEYLFHLRVSQDETLFAIASDTFNVGQRFEFLAFIKSSFLFLLIILISILVILFVLRYKSMEERKRNLHLYVQALHLKKLMAAQKFDDAVNLFIKMKNEYGEPITKEMLEDKEDLKTQMKMLADKFDLEDKAQIIKKSNEEKNVGKNNLKQNENKNFNKSVKKINSLGDKKETLPNPVVENLNKKEEVEKK